MIERPNLKYVDELAGDDIAFRNQFIEIIKDEFPIEKKEYLDHIAQNKLKETAEMVHKLKHKFNILGMEKSYQLAVDYEKELLMGKTNSEPKFMTVLDTIESYIKTI
ncbi:Hpt domain-containing protein [Maribacter confluentis]|uniref:Hpt domain-containing protein n=1 Tax=Maribacter confluentis TaxID=1656093 RepID=A0ABT8RTI1_9FLAO|nr:Hpt domain-containing protein [Maribacter confluentis]MDO1514140.1 Hpt domain-containing protein [Maribacter confluentis]